MFSRSSHCRVLLAGAFGAMLHAGAFAATPPAAPTAQMVEVTSLAGLPEQIRADLGAGEKGVISDRGGPFEPGCLMGDGKPSQRFMLAALGAGTAVVAVEHGGIMHGASSREYRLAKGRWTLVSSGAPTLHLAGHSDLLAQHTRTAQPADRKRP